MVLNDSVNDRNNVSNVNSRKKIKIEHIMHSTLQIDRSNVLSSSEKHGSNYNGLLSPSSANDNDYNHRRIEMKHRINAANSLSNHKIRVMKRKLFKNDDVFATPVPLVKTESMSFDDDGMNKMRSLSSPTTIMSDKGNNKVLTVTIDGIADLPEISIPNDNSNKDNTNNNSNETPSGPSFFDFSSRDDLNSTSDTRNNKQNGDLNESLNIDSKSNINKAVMFEDNVNKVKIQKIKKFKVM